MIRAVRVMAVATVLANRGVFPQVRTALLCMTAKTGVVCRCPYQQSFGAGAMRAVTVATVHFALPYRMRIRLHCLCTLLLVTVETHFRLSRCDQHRILRRVTGVAIRTGDLLHIVRAAVPRESKVVLVAVCAVTVLLENRGHTVCTESDDRRLLLTTPNTPGMRTARAMTGLALQLAMRERCTRVSSYGVLAAKYRERCLVVVTGKTGIRTLATVLRVRALRLSRQGWWNKKRAQDYQARHYPKRMRLRNHSAIQLNSNSPTP
jgi:hypothetical protein